VRAIDFSVISATENSNKFQKTRFGRKNQLEHLGQQHGATLVTIMKEVCDYIW
jgi:hypothetical protein